MTVTGQPGGSFASTALEAATLEAALLHEAENTPLDTFVRSGVRFSPAVAGDAARSSSSSSTSSSSTPSTTPASVVQLQPQGSPKPLRGSRRPRWRLCFRLDRQAEQKHLVGGVRWKQQRDFFVTVVDPPVVGSPKCPAPFFASEMACQLANLLVSRQLLEQIPGRSFEGRSVAAIGKDCLVAGLVAAMLGARVAFLCERQYRQHVQQNVKLYLKDALDYTKLKSTSVVVATGSGSKNRWLGPSICEQLNAAVPIDIVIATEAASEALAETSEITGDGPGDLWTLFADLVPTSSSTRVLLVCDGTSALLPPDPQAFPTRAQAEAEAFLASAATGINCPLPPGLRLPQEWQAQTICCIGRQFPVVWLERSDAGCWRDGSKRPVLPLRRYLPAMGSSSAKCGCGGHPQRSFLNHRVLNHAWYENNEQLKMALAAHNQSKDQEVSRMLDEARALAFHTRGVEAAARLADEEVSLKEPWKPRLGRQPQNCRSSLSRDSQSSGRRCTSRRAADPRPYNMSLFDRLAQPIPWYPYPFRKAGESTGPAG
mmetsp:Transcript_28224/g.61627  ORF Transcript_28224/g.61627 Transcript_28224/m.61627 type:complete len:542 (+) Transcript_28224:50-1675(+)